jgi:hypothetical protein
MKKKNYIIVKNIILVGKKKRGVVGISRDVIATHS